MDSYFDDTSMLRRVHREFAVALSGPRALLMQAAHPVAFEGFFAHSGALDEPYERLRRTAEVMNTIGFGSRADADRATRRVRAMHSKIRGELERPAGRFPAGTPFAADDPELLLWVLATLVDSALVFYDRYVASLSHAERDAYWQDYRVVGGLFGLRGSRDARRDPRVRRLHARHAQRRAISSSPPPPASSPCRSSCARRSAWRSARSSSS